MSRYDWSNGYLCALQDVRRELYAMHEMSKVSELARDPLILAIEVTFQLSKKENENA